MKIVKFSEQARKRRFCSICEKRLKREEAFICEKCHEETTGMLEDQNE
jgi:predicted amidophosphoribosyltransferase